MTDDELVALVRRTVHPTLQPDPDAATTCQCVTCFRVERAFLAFASEARREARQHGDRARRLLVETQGKAIELATELLAKTVYLAQVTALIGLWKALAVIERENARTSKPITPAMRSNLNHRALVYDICAEDLRQIRARS